MRLFIRYGLVGRNLLQAQNVFEDDHDDGEKQH